MKCFQDSYIYPTVLLEVLGLIKYQRHVVHICYLTFSSVPCSMMSVYQIHYLRCLILQEYQGNMYMINAPETNHKKIGQQLGTSLGSIKNSTGKSSEISIYSKGSRPGGEVARNSIQQIAPNTATGRGNPLDCSVSFRKPREDTCL